MTNPDVHPSVRQFFFFLLLLLLPVMPTRKNDRYIRERVLLGGGGGRDSIRSCKRERETSVEEGRGEERTTNAATIFAFNAGNTVNCGIFLLINRFVWVRAAIKG